LIGCDENRKGEVAYVPKTECEKKLSELVKVIDAGLESHGHSLVELDRAIQSRLPIHNRTKEDVRNAASRSPYLDIIDEEALAVVVVVFKYKNARAGFALSRQDGTIIHGYAMWRASL
jgi:hypothetical protein